MNKVSITIPTVQGNGKRIGIDRRIDMLLRAEFILSELFGGCTSIEGVGSWVNDKSEIVQEDVTVVTSYTDAVTGDHIVRLRILSSDLARQGKQECILFVVEKLDGFIEFVQQGLK